MFISDKYKFLFFEVPRTGSNSVTAALSDFDPDSPTVALRNAENRYSDYHHFHIPPHAREYRFFAAHRNPYDRLWSHWKFRHHNGNPEIFKTTPWHRYVQWAFEPESVPEIQRAIFEVPITEMFDYQRVTHWLRFEDLTNSWHELREALDLDLPNLPFRQSSPAMADFRDAYDGELAAMVAQRFASDFDQFGYDPDAWRCPTMITTSSSPGEEPRRPKVAILTHFVQSLAAFSLNRVVQDQLTMLTKHGYQPRVLVTASEAWSDPQDNYSMEGIELIEYPRFPEEIDDQDTQQTENEINELSLCLENALSDVDVVFTHDIIYMGRSKKIMQAAWNVAHKFPTIRWLHWIHSAANPRLLNMSTLAQQIHDNMLEKKWPNSYAIFFNRMSIPRIAENFGYSEQDVKIVPHPVDVATFLGFSERSMRIYEDCRLYAADFVAVFPTRLNMTKQIDWIIKIMARLKYTGAIVRALFIDFHSNSDVAKNYRDEMKSIARDWDLDSDELVFLSEYDDSLKFEAPHSMVRELFSVSNLYIQPSVSESYSLAAQEAGLMGNLLILNADFPPMQEMYGDHALYYHFSSYIDSESIQNGQTVTSFEDIEFEVYPEMVPPALVREQDDRWVVGGEVAYADMIARDICNQFADNMILAQRQKRLRDRNIFSVFSNFLEPLLYQQPSKSRSGN